MLLSLTPFKRVLKDYLAVCESYYAALHDAPSRLEAIGDYVAGPNHVLPTSRTARFSSGLSVVDFMKRTSVLSCDAGALSQLGPAALALAKAEGLGAHGRSIAIRLNKQS